MNTYLEDDSACILLDNGIIYFRYKVKVVDLEIQKKNIADRVVLSAGIPRPVFVDARPVSYWTKEARDYSMKEEHMKLMKGIAFQYNSYVHTVLFNWVIRFMNTPVPIRAFKSKEKALKWLNTLVV